MRSSWSSSGVMPPLQFDIAPPSSLARTEASFGPSYCSQGGFRELQHNEQDDNGDDDLFAVTHLNPNHGPDTID